MRIAHISDPHVSRRYHPQHLKRLRKTLRHALESLKAEHIVISGDITSTAEAQDFEDTRRLLADLDLLRSELVTVVPGNHDIYGGPHLAEDVLAFPALCKSCDYDVKLSFFKSVFAELFEGAKTTRDLAFPFLKRVGAVALIGVDSNAKHSYVRNPVGSNGELSKAEFAALAELCSKRLSRTANHRILVAHHHFFRRREESELAQFLKRSQSMKLFRLLEAETLKLRGKRKLLKLLEQHDVGHVLHGHVHFTGSYRRGQVHCHNGAGAVTPLFAEDGYAYNLLEAHAHEIEATRVGVPI